MASTVDINVSTLFCKVYEVHGNYFSSRIKNSVLNVQFTFKIIFTFRETNE